MLLLELTGNPGFDVIYGGVSMRLQRFVCTRLSNPHMTCFPTPFHRDVHHRGF